MFWVDRRHLIIYNIFYGLDTENLLRQARRRSNYTAADIAWRTWIEMLRFAVLSSVESLSSRLIRESRMHSLKLLGTHLIDALMMLMNFEKNCRWIDSMAKQPL